MAHNVGVGELSAGRDSPSQRLLARRDEWDAPVPGPSGLQSPARDPMTLCRTGQRIVDGLPLRDAAADFLDDLRWARDADDVERRIAAEPPTAGAHADAYLAALAEHVAARHNIAAPAWEDPGRFLDHLWWPSRIEGLRARAVVESPAAFRRRGIFIGRTTLRRV